MTTWADYGTMKVEFAIGVGPVTGSAAALMMEVETETSGTSSAAIGSASIETSWTGLSWFTIYDATAGLIETGGMVADDTVTDADWVDVTAYVSAQSIRHLKPSRFGGFDGRTLTLTLQDDETRRWDPLNPSGPYVELLREGMRVRASFTMSGTTYWLFTGFVSNWPVNLGTWPASEVTIECVDWFGPLARFDGAAVAAVGAGETVTARINRILDAYGTSGIATVERDIGTSAITCASTTLSDNTVSMVKAAAASDGGDIWVAPDGRITFRSLTEQWASDRLNNVQWTLTNVTSGLPLEVDYEGDPAVSNDLRDTISQAVLARAGGTEQSAVDATMLDMWGPRTVNRSDLINASDTDVLALATWLVSTQPTLPVRISQAVIRPDVHTEALTMAVQAQLWDRVRVSHVQIGGTTISRDGLIVGVEHRIEDTRWSTVWTLQDVTGSAAITVETSAIESDEFVAP